MADTDKAQRDRKARLRAVTTAVSRCSNADSELVHCLATDQDGEGEHALLHAESAVRHLEKALVLTRDIERSLRESA